MLQSSFFDADVSFLGTPTGQNQVIKSSLQIVIPIDNASDGGYTRHQQ